MYAFVKFFNYNCFLSLVSSFPLPCFFRLPGIAARQPSRQAGQVAALKMEPRHRKQNEDEHDDDEHDADDETMLFCTVKQRMECLILNGARSG